MIVAPPMKATSNDLADWLELEVLSAGDGRALLVTVNQNLEIGEDIEPEELDEENRLAEVRLQQVASAISERIATIGSAYPFEIDPAGQVLTLTQELTEGGCTYLFCLIVSHGARDGFLSGEGPWAPDLPTARSLFHICATVSAAGFLVGPAFSVGWPRPDSTTFLEKLRIVYGLLRDGVVHPAIPPGAPQEVKDDGIDVIAWRHEPAPGAGTIVFVGQAASGANWAAKSLKGAVETFHGTWFAQQPASQVSVGTIIPFCLPTDADASDHEDQEAIAASLDVVAGLIRRETLKHGIVLFRHRVAACVDRAIAIRHLDLGPIERIDELQELCNYVASYRTQLREAVAGVA